MKNRLRQTIALFLTGFALLGQSCVEEELLPERIPFVWETNNWAARRLLRQLQEQPAASEEFLTVLSGEKAFYSGIRLIGMPEYGLCYFIPYGSDKVEGALFYPLDSELREDGTYLLEGMLNSPDNINASRLNEDIPITKRFLYSMPFKELQEQGVEVLPALVACAEALDGKSVPISEEESSFPPGTRANFNDVIFIELRFSAAFYGEEDGNGGVTVTGLGQSTIKNVLQTTFWKMNVKIRIEPEYIPPFIVHFALPASELGNPDAFFPAFFWTLQNEFSLRGFSPNIQHEIYYNHAPWGSSGESSGGNTGGGTTGGSSGTGGGGGGSSSSGGNSSSTSTPSFDEPVADTSRGCKRIQSQIEKLWTTLNSVEAKTIGINKYISFQTYLDEVTKDPKHEHATLLIDYEDEENTRVLTEVFHGSENNVMQTISSNYVTAQIHNHPNGSPPSAQDLLFTAEMMRDEHNYQATFIYNHRNESYYSLYVYSSETGENLYRSLYNEIDPVTHDFKSTSKCEQILNNHTYVYQKFSREMKQIYRLCIIIEEYGRGIAITKYNTETKRNEVYRVKRGKDKKGKEIYTPLIYE